MKFNYKLTVSDIRFSNNRTELGVLDFYFNNESDSISMLNKIIRKTQTDVINLNPPLNVKVYIIKYNKEYYDIIEDWSYENTIKNNALIFRGLN